ncbi:MAG: hypothetical protein ACE5OY_02195 [Candidatus Bathyarchaeia archaeon]
MCEHDIDPWYDRGIDPDTLVDDPYSTTALDSEIDGGVERRNSRYKEDVKGSLLVSGTALSHWHLSP